MLAEKGFLSNYGWAWCSSNKFIAKVRVVLYAPTISFKAPYIPQFFPPLPRLCAIKPAQYAPDNTLPVAMNVLITLAVPLATLLHAASANNCTHNGFDFSSLINNEVDYYAVSVALVYQLYTHPLFRAPPWRSLQLNGRPSWRYRASRAQLFLFFTSIDDRFA